MEENRVIVELDGSLWCPLVNQRLTTDEAMRYAWSFRLPDGTLFEPDTIT